MSEEQENRSGTELEEIFKSGGILTGQEGNAIHCLTVVGQIEGHYALGEGQKATKYEHLIPLLVSIEQNEDIKGLLLILNTMGGDVEAGLALAEMVASMKKPTVSLVLGGGHSIGVPLAVAGKRSFMVPSATMTLHPVRISGTVIGAPQTYRYFHDMQDRILTFIAGHSRADRDTLAAMMMKPDQIANDVGTILNGEDAVRIGLIDEVGGLDEALACLKDMIARNGNRQR